MLVHEIPEGGWGKIAGKWYVRPPGTRRAAMVTDQHLVLEGDNGLTLLPSVVYGTPENPNYFHGWLTDGVWRDTGGRVIERAGAL